MNTAPSVKKAAQVALCAMGVLFILSIIFYRERLFADTSYIAFNIVNYRGMSIQNQRYGSFITQIVPDFGQKLHLSLTTILAGYSISFNLFFFVVAAILFFGLRQYALTVLMAMYYYLIVSDSYFLANDEIHQAIAWMFLMFGVVNYLKQKNANTIVLIAGFLPFAFLALFTHFIVIIPIVFLWIYFILDADNPLSSKKQTILLSSLLVAIILVKFAITGTSQRYEEEHLHRLTHFSLPDIVQSFISPVVAMFCLRSITNYWIAIPVAVLGIRFLLKNNQKKLAAWTIISIVGYFIVMGLTYGNLDKNVKLFHIETEWESIGILLAAPFVFNVLPRLKARSALSAVAFVFIVRLAYILGYSAPAFIWRVHFHEQVLAQMRKKNIIKLALYHEQELNDKYVLEWTAPYESLFESARNGDKPQLTFMFVNKDEKNIIESIKDPKGVFLADFVQIANINADYFQPDASRPYELMTVAELFK